MIVKWLEWEFQVFPPTEDWNEVAGLYVFAGPHLDLVHGKLWKAYYIGGTNSFRSRLPTHEKWSEAEQLGSTHIHLLVVPEGLMRHLMEERLIAYYRPPLNVQGK